MARILLVDDEDAPRRMFEAVLRGAGHDVTTASDGNGALAALAKGTFDLVLTDIIMPDKEGIETIMTIRKLKPELKIIAMSGGGRGDKSTYLETAAMLGASTTLSKPFSPQALRDVVDDVLAS